MNTMMMRKVQGDGVMINVMLREGTGDSILCVHGLTANCRSWDTIAGSLNPPHPIIAMDLRGRGRSDKPERGYSITHHIRDIAMLLDGLSLEKVIIMGHSLGGYISLAFAAHYPERVAGLVLVDGGGVLPMDLAERFSLAIKPALDRLGVTFPSYDAYVAPMKMAPFFKPWTEGMDEYFRYEIEEVAGGYSSVIDPQTILEESMNLQDFDPSECYPLIGCPTLILRATRGILGPGDMLLPEASIMDMQKNISAARRVDLADTDHFSIVFQQNETRDRALKAFLASL